MTPEKFQEQYVIPAPGRTLITGSRVVSSTREDRRKHYPKAVGVDMLPGVGVDEVMNLETDSLKDKLGQFHHVECVSVLEHTKRPWSVAENIQAAMKPDATIYLSVPFVWRIHAYPDDYWRMTISAVRFIFPDIEWKHLMYIWPTGSSDKKIPHIESLGDVGVVYFARSEVAGFGVRK